MVFDARFLAILGGCIGLAGGFAGSSIGIGIAGAAGCATLAEDPKQFRNVLVLASFPVTQTFYALTVLLIIITRVVPNLAPDSGGGLAVLGTGIAVASAEWFSAWYQGVVCAAGISLLPKTRGQIFVRTTILAAYVEFLGQLGIVFSVVVFTMAGIL